MNALARIIRRLRFRRWVNSLPQSSPAQDARVVAFINARLAGN